MAEAVGALFIDLSANSAAFAKDMGKARTSLGSSSARMNRSLGLIDRGFSKARQSAGGFGRQMLSVRGIMAAAASAFTLGKIFQVTGEFEDLRTSLKTVSGGARQAAADFDFINKVAAKTPFSIQTMTKAFITLKATGIEPTEKLLLGFSDAASVTTDRLGTFEAQVRLLSRSTEGGLGLEELNQLADRGLPVWKIFKEELGLTRLELSDVGKTAEGARTLIDALQRGMDKRFGGATAEALQNLTTKTSNLGDAVSRAMESFALSTGLMTAYKAAITAATENSEGFTRAFKEDNFGVLKFWRDLLGISEQALDKTNKALDARKNAATPATAGAGPTPFKGADLTSIQKAIQAARFKEDEQAKALQKSTQALRLKAAQQQQLTSAVGRGATAYSQLKAELDLENAAAAKNIDLSTKQGQAWADSFRAAGTATAGLDSIKRAQERVAETALEAGDAFGNFAAALISKSATAKDALRGLVAELAALTLRKSITEPISSLFASGFKSILPGFAHGGQFTVGGAGGTDRQPVNFMATKGERVTVETPPQQRRGGGGGSTFIFKVDARGADIGVEARVLAALEQVSNSIEPRALNAVAFDRAHGGATGTAAGG